MAILADELLENLESPNLDTFAVAIWNVENVDDRDTDFEVRCCRIILNRLKEPEIHTDSRDLPWDVVEVIEGLDIDSRVKVLKEGLETMAAFPKNTNAAVAKALVDMFFEEGFGKFNLVQLQSLENEVRAAVKRYHAFGETPLTSLLNMLLAIAAYGIVDADERLSAITSILGEQPEDVSKLVVERSRA